MRLPGHNYIGPGNDLDIGDPIDEDDLIALQHDIRYELAHSEDDIINADLDAIDEFLRDFYINNNYHSIVGAIGLSFKFAFEKVFGVIYPMAGGSKKKALNRGNYRYAYIQSKIYQEYRSLKQTENISYRQFITSDYYRHLRAQASQDFDNEYPPGTKFESINTGNGDEDIQDGIGGQSDSNGTNNDSSNNDNNNIHNEIDDIVPETQIEDVPSSSTGQLRGDRRGIVNSKYGTPTTLYRPGKTKFRATTIRTIYKFIT